MYTQQLYQQHCSQIQKRHTQPAHARREYMLRVIVDLPHNCAVTLENSIPLLKQLGMIEQIRSIGHIVELMENKKGEEIGWENQGRQLWQCRLIYFMWHVVGHEQIQMRDFKELIIMLSSQDEDREELIQSVYGQKEEIYQLIQTWDHLLCQDNPNSPNPRISSFRILKTKNEGDFGFNKVDALQQHVYNSNASNSLHRSSSKQTKKRVQSSNTKKSAKTVDRGDSRGRSVCRNSGLYSLKSCSIPSQQINFFNESDMLSLDDQKRLVDRLYDCSKYYTREKIKQQIEQQRKQAEIKQCTFKPQINKNSATLRQPTKRVKGFDRAINRMKQGYEKAIQLKENLEYRCSKQLAPLANRLTQCIPPKLHSKSIKQQKPGLFQAKFSFGKMSIPIKVRQDDNVDELINRISRIYSLKVHEKSFIRLSIIQKLQKYKKTIQQSFQHLEL